MQKKLSFKISDKTRDQLDLALASYESAHGKKMTITEICFKYGVHNFIDLYAPSK